MVPRAAQRRRLQPAEALHLAHPVLPPDEPGLACNEWRYRVWREALAYARVMGMETWVGFSTGTVPPSTWLRHPELRAQDVHYTGITLCWRRGKERILPFQEHLIDSFADVADSFVFWFADPGALHLPGVAATTWESCSIPWKPCPM